MERSHVMEVKKYSSIGFGTRVTGAILLLGTSSFCAANAQSGASTSPSGSKVVLPGDVPIAGSSTRGWVGAPPNPAVTPQPAPPQAELSKQGAQLEQRLDALKVSEPAGFGTVLPGITSNTPVAYGGFQGMGGIGIGYQERTRYANTDDAVAALVLSFGSPQTVGVDIIGNILDTGGNGGSFGDRASLSFKVHRPLSDTLAVAFGGEDVLIRNRTLDQRHSYFGVVTKQVNLKPNGRDAFSRLHLSLGVGNGRFQSEQDVFAGKDGLGVFGSVAVQATPAIRPFMEWTGQDLNVGVSLVPFKRIPLVLTPALADVTHHAGNKTRFTLGAAYSFQY